MSIKLRYVMHVLKSISTHDKIPLKVILLVLSFANHHWLLTTCIYGFTASIFDEKVVTTFLENSLVENNSIPLC